MGEMRAPFERLDEFVSLRLLRNFVGLDQDVVPYHLVAGRAHARAMKGVKQPDAVQADDDGDGEHAAWLVVVRALRSVAPDIDIEEINRYEPLQDEADLDASDWLHLMAAVTEQTGVVVPKQDYPLVDTFDGLERYLAAQKLSRGR
jgi:hypothetical protein